MISPKKNVKTVAVAPQPKVREESLLIRATGWVILFFAATLPLYYDLAVPEVSGDIRWMATSFYAGLTGLMLLVEAFRNGGGKVQLRWPLIFWFALGVALWSAVSMLDAINWLRGIILIKALYSQLLLMAVVYVIATPRFLRQLMWALAAPMAFTSFLGICQFHGWTGSSFSAVLSGGIFFWTQPLFWVLGYVIHVLGGWINDWPNSYNFVDQITGYFQQSAVPGSTFANKNLAGSWTGMMLPLALFLLITAKRWWAQSAASILLALGSVFLIYARARASWVALFASMMTLAVLIVIVPAWRQAVLRHLDWKHGVWLLLPLLAIVRYGGDISPVQGAHAVDRTPAQQMEALTQSSWDEIGGRVAYNLNSMVITKDFWFNGVGLGNFYTIYPPYYDAVVVTPTNSYSVMARPQRTHTDLMEMFTELGIPGGIAYAGLFISAIVMGLGMAGTRARNLAGNLVGAGLFTCVLTLMLFLEYQGMLSFPEPWNLLVQLLFGGLILALLVRAGFNAWAVQKETKAADDTQLLGLLGGIAMLTICINALMDFPMQLPTAPAAAALLMGAIAGIYHSRYPKVFGPHLTLPAGKPVVAGALVVLTLAWSWALYDAYYFREGNKLLKVGMIRTYAGLNDDTTMQILEGAYKVYPYDPRIQENMAVVYANYNGTYPMSIEDRIGKIEWTLKGDPWGANHLINLAGQYLRLAEVRQSQGDAAGAKEALDRVEVLYGRLVRVANASQYTWGVGGMMKLLQNQPEDAVSMFRRALAIDPNYQPAQSGLQAAASRLKVQPIKILDAIVK